MSQSGVRGPEPCTQRKILMELQPAPHRTNTSVLTLEGAGKEKAPEKIVREKMHLPYLLKTFTCQWTHAVQTCVVQGLTVFVF